MTDETTTQQRVTDDWQIEVHPGFYTTYAEMRRQAESMANKDHRNSVEEGLARAVLLLIEDAERRAHE